MKLISSAIFLLLLTSSTTNNIRNLEFDNAKWKTKNLNVSKFRNGDEILEAKTVEEWIKAGETKTPAFCYYENDKNNGKLYNWYAVKDERELAPKGWHIASDEEWNNLIEKYGGIKKASEMLNGKKFLSSPNGFRDINGKFSSKGFSAYYWTSTTDNFFLAYNRQIFADNSEIIRGSSHHSMGFSIRCVKDSK